MLTIIDLITVLGYTIAVFSIGYEAGKCAKK